MDEKVVVRKINGGIILIRENTVDEWVIEEVYKQNPYIPEFLLNFIPKNGIVIDAGAHIGCFTAIANKLLNPELIIAIEPEENNYNLLVQNAKILGIEGKLKPVRIALWDSTETLTFYLQNWNTGGHSLIEHKADVENVSKENIRKVSVNATTLDNLLDDLGLSEKHITLLKLDAEGAEDRVLKGAEKTLKRTCAVVGELHESIVNREKIKSLLNNFLVVFGTPIPPLNMLNFWGIRKDLLNEEIAEEFIKKAQLYDANYIAWYYQFQYKKSEEELKKRTEWAKRLDRELEETRRENERLRKLLEERNANLLQVAEKVNTLTEKVNTIAEKVNESEKKLDEIMSILKERLHKIETFLKESCLILDSGSYHGVMDTVKYIEHRIAPFSEFHLLIRPLDIEKYRNSPIFSTIYLIPSGVKNRLSLLLNIRKRRFRRAVVVYSDTPGVRKFHLFASLSGAKELYIWDGRTPFYRISKFTSLPVIILATPLALIPLIKEGVSKIFNILTMPIKVLYLSLFYLVVKTRAKMK